MRITKYDEYDNNNKNDDLLSIILIGINSINSKNVFSYEVYYNNSIIFLNGILKMPHRFECHALEM